MSRFFYEWGRLLVAPFVAMGGLSAMTNLARLVLALLAAGTFTALAFFWHEQLSMPLGLLLLIVVGVGYFSFTAGMAWDRAFAPSVDVGPLQLDVPIKLFYVLVTNGPVAAKVKLRVVRVVDSFGREHLDRPWEGHWRSRLADFDGELPEHVPAQYGLLGVAVFEPSRNPALFIYSREPGWHPIGDGYNATTVSRDAPLEQQGTTTFHVVVTCETATGQKGKPQKLAFHVAPDPGSPVGYKFVADEKPAVTKRFQWDKTLASLRNTFHRLLQPPPAGQKKRRR
jgi:hypothetical protein